MKKWIPYCLVILWCTIIFLFSNESGAESDVRSKGVLNGIITVYDKITNTNRTPEEVEEILEKGNHLIRKTAHFTVYLVLGILVIQCFDPKHYPISKRILYSLLFCAIYASFDEFHQLFLSGRSGQIQDVLLDSSGSLTGLFFYFLWQKRKLLKEEAKHEKIRDNLS